VEKRVLQAESGGDSCLSEEILPNPQKFRKKQTAKHWL
jgi:hypothetical protein